MIILKPEREIRLMHEAGKLLASCHKEIAKIIEPDIPHYGSPGKGLRLKEGMVITIEPMINEGTWFSKLDANGWTARTVDGKWSAQYEHTVAITSNGPLVLTQQ